MASLPMTGGLGATAPRGALAANGAKQGGKLVGAAEAAAEGAAAKTVNAGRAENSLESASGKGDDRLAKGAPGGTATEEVHTQSDIQGGNAVASDIQPAGVTASSRLSANLTERGTLTNVHPGDSVFLQSTPRTLVQDSKGRYYLKSSKGRLITPSGEYNFVTLPDGTIKVARQNTNAEFSTHLGLSHGGEVNYAGTIRFTNNTTPRRGSIIRWSNDSGHYLPPASRADKAGLPLDLFSNKY